MGNNGPSDAAPPPEAEDSCCLCGKPVELNPYIADGFSRHVEVDTRIAMHDECSSTLDLCLATDGETIFLTAQQIALQTEKAHIEAELEAIKDQLRTMVLRQ